MRIRSLSVQLFATLSSTSASIGLGVSLTSGKRKSTAKNIKSIKPGEIRKLGLLFC